MPPEQMAYVHTLSFYLFKQHTLAPAETAALSRAFEDAVEHAADGAPIPSAAWTKSTPRPETCPARTGMSTNPTMYS